MKTNLPFGDTHLRSFISRSLNDQMVEWRHHIHSFPECGFAVEQTSEFIADHLERMGLEVFRKIGKTGLVGVLRNGKSNTSIGLRADMDALHIHEQNTFSHRSRTDGKMHACGHDGHSAMLLGAASYLSEKKCFDGTVYFIFQPDEEHGKGALAMIDDGLFERFPMDGVYGLHNLPGLPAGSFTVRAGSIMASESSFEIVLNGGGGHAAMPFATTDPLVAGAQLVLALQTIVSRNLNAIQEAAVVSVTEFITNGTVNVLPSQVTIKGDCRCFTDETLNQIEVSMERITSGVCHSVGIEFEFNFTRAFHSTINSKEHTEYAVNAAIDVLGEDNVNANCDPYTISEDFSSMLRVQPGCYALLGNGVDSIGGCALHNPHYDFNDDILSSGANYWIQLVCNQLKN